MSSRKKGRSPAQFTLNLVNVQLLFHSRLLNPLVISGRREKARGSACTRVSQKHHCATRTDDIDVEEIQRQIEEQYTMIEDMQRWLDKFLKN
jgi:hypothetical protein